MMQFPARTARAFGLGSALWFACIRPTTKVDTPSETPPSVSQQQSGRKEKKRPENQRIRCMDAKQSTFEISSVPLDTRALVLIRTDDPQWPTSAKRFDQWLRNSEEAKLLPLRTKFELSLLETESQLVQQLLDPIDGVTKTYLKIMPPQGQAIWEWRHACDLDDLSEILRHRWQLAFRRDLRARVGVVFPPNLFPFEVLLMSSGRGLFVPPRSHSSTLVWLEQPSAVSLVPTADDDLRAIMVKLQGEQERSPLIIVSQSTGFLGTQTSGHSDGAPLHIVVRNQNLWINGKLDTK